MDTVDDSKALAQKLSLAYPILSDTDHKLTKAFGVFDVGNEIAWPAVYVIDKAGKVAWRGFLETYKERVSISEILSATKAAGGG